MEELDSAELVMFHPSTVADLENFVGGGRTICWPLAVAGHLVIGDNLGSRSRSVVIHVVS